MIEREPSKTAVGVATLRAFHQLVDEMPKILEDPAILRLLDPAVIEQIHLNPSQFQTPQAVALRTHIVIRSRYAEDRLTEAFQRGVRQYILLGAGLDTFPYRQPEWADALRIYEVDQPGSQREKLQRLQNAAIPIPSNVAFVSIDFERMSLNDGLRSSSFDSTRPTFISWLGVMVYLSQEAVDEVFRFAASLPRTSEIVFTFSQPLQQSQKANQEIPTLAERAKQLGEPWKTFITPPELVHRLRELGFSSIIIPTQDETDARYTRQRHDGLRASKRTTLASAIV